MSKSKHKRAYQDERQEDAMLPPTPGFHEPLIKGKAPNALAELGDTGLTRFGGMVQDEFLVELQGDRGRKTYTEMWKNDAVIAAMFRAITWIVRGVDWSVDGGPDKANEFLESCLDDMSFSWEDTLSEFLSFLVYGWQYSEVVYKYRKGPDADPSSRYNDGLVGWRKFASRSQLTLLEWMFDDAGGIRGMVQHGQKGERLEIPIEKAVLFRTSIEKNNPEGESLLRSAYRSWYLVKNMQEIEGIGVERDLAGLPIVYLGDGCTMTGSDSDLAVMKKIVRNVRRDEQEGIVIPKPKLTSDGKGILFELLSSGSRRNFDIGGIIERYEKRMAMSLLAQWLMLGMNTVGSYALSRDQSDFFRQAVEAILRIIASTLNRYAVPRLFKLNPAMLSENDEMPQISYSLPIPPDLAQYAAAVNALVMAQVLNPNDQGVRDSVRSVMGLPEEEVVETPEEPTTTQDAAESEQAAEDSGEMAGGEQDAGDVGQETAKAFDVTKAASDFTDEEREYAKKWIEKAAALRKAGKRATSAS